MGKEPGMQLEADIVHVGCLSLTTLSSFLFVESGLQSVPVLGFGGPSGELVATAPLDKYFLGNILKI